jgi:hypothetical protein
MDKRVEAFNIFKQKILKPVENTNKYVARGVTNEDRRKFFTSYNKDLAERVITIKSIK